MLWKIKYAEATPYICLGAIVFIISFLGYKYSKKENTERRPQIAVIEDQIAIIEDRIDNIEDAINRLQDQRDDLTELGDEIFITDTDSAKQCLTLDQ